ncbi:Uncharacterised protein [Mycobacteroides abscessus subsp. massiliense]|nr:Uncharacterised protein [Mycobacteroides abscessus subsp. massiliense]SKU14220.1 Uncharacterised protein [Mycobacteroides abscessus subsp. massiliense]
MTLWRAMIPHLGFHPELVSYVSTGDLFTRSNLLSYRTSYQGVMC